LHSGFSNAVLCESEWVKDFAISLGLNSSNLFVTGSIAHDEMFEVLEKRKNAQKSVIVVAIPPDMFPSSRYKNLEFTDFIEMLDFLAKSVTKSTNMRVVASPHPSLNGDHIDYLKRMGFEIAENGVHVELCNASFFIASISATIQWAMAITVPVINYDLYRFDYPDYLGVSGVVKCETKADFLEILQKFCQLVPQVNLEEIPEHSYYGVVDGRAVDRIEARIQSLF
jgi:UDP-N-acetylglucosamine 2-epimerase